MAEQRQKLVVRNLGQIKSGEIDFADFTLLVGPQASGKSIVLQLLKLLIDREVIASELRTNGYTWEKKPEAFLELFFGEQMSRIWTKETQIYFNKKPYSLANLIPKKVSALKEEQLFYIPAQRVVTMFQGWPRSFGAFDAGDPFVLKSFSESIRLLMEKDNSSKTEQTIFPQRGRIKESLRTIIDNGIFHGATIELDKSTLKKRFLLNVNDGRLPFMNWSAGQKEFMPLLLSFYQLMPPSKVALKNELKWVVVEEPEMGLHPKAIQAVLVVFLELIARGYKLVISTHSPVLLELVWAIQFMKKHNGTTTDLFELFDMPPNQQMKAVFKKTLAAKSFHTYSFDRGESGVTINDISALDAGSSNDHESSWGGLSSFVGRASDIISRLVANG